MNQLQVFSRRSILLSFRSAHGQVCRALMKASTFSSSVCYCVFAMFSFKNLISFYRGLTIAVISSVSSTSFRGKYISTSFAKAADVAEA